MADTMVLECPECGKQIKAPADVAGKKVKCKGCGEVFQAGAAPARPSAPKPTAKKDPRATAKTLPPRPVADEADEGDDMGDGKPYGVIDDKLGSRCPECANAMGEGDIICLKCGYNTRTRQRHESKLVADITGGDYFLHLLPGFLCLFVVIILIVWDILFLLRADLWFDGDDWLSSFLRHGSMKLYNTIISLFIMFFTGKFAIKRLILNPHPPEVELKK